MARHGTVNVNTTVPLNRAEHAQLRNHAHNTCIYMRTWSCEHYSEMAGAWNKEETLKLIEIWGNDAIQAQLEGCKRNQDIYSKIAAEMTEAGHERTAQQCRNKIKKLKVDYWKTKDKRKKTGEGRYPEWDYINALASCVHPFL